MLRVTIESNGKTTVRDLIVIDSHSHMGKDVDGAEMMNPMSPGRGTFDFWTMVENRIRKDWDEGKSSPHFSTTINGISSKFSVDFVQMPLITKLYQALETRNQSGNFTNAYERIQNQRLIDQAVCFPFQDIFRDKKPEALYRASNINVARQVSKFPVSLRMIGYIRVNPMEGQKALDEIDYWAKQGIIRGLKLHPRSEGWVDSVTSPEAVRVLMKAASYNFPVIFDTRGKQTIMDIGELIRITRQTMQAQKPELLKTFKVIIAHFAQGNVDDDEVYRVITQPNTWGDLSMLHGKGTAVFLKSFRSWCIQYNIHQKTGRDWSEFLLFATDYPYFGDAHAKELIVYLFNQDFYEGGGSVNDSANILGLNQIRLLPEYSTKLIYNHVKTPVSTYLQSTISLPTDFPKKPENNLTVNEMMYQTLAALIDDGVIDIKKILFQFRGDWHNYDEEFCLITNPKGDSSQNIPLLYLKLHKNELGMLGTLPNDFAWKELGYHYFDPDSRKLFQHMFANNFPAAVPVDAAQMLIKAFK